MKTVLIEIDSAVSMADMEWMNEETDNPSMRFVEKNEYKYLTFLPLNERSRQLWPLCSKDKKEWTICVGATKDGKKLDLQTIAAALEKV